MGIFLAVLYIYMDTGGFQPEILHGFSVRSVVKYEEYVIVYFMSAIDFKSRFARTVV
jgi:hypothetical protein